MRRIRRNAFALGKKGDVSPADTLSSPDYSQEGVFDIVPSSHGVVLPSDAEDVESGSPSCSHLTEVQVQAFREVFDLFDSNGGGTIDAEELDLALKSVDIHLSQEDLQEVVGAMDKDGNGEIDFYEFLNLMTNTERFLEGLGKDRPF
ncbi:calmodulin-like protein 12 [Orbicella faveolata]|uniref:calmodulin-like protein 12 n=1 Tax=Orbicella faveolata TaxID=48498 RepID=UPI0009E55EE8|nr:calmodulin-like protein 12 [Orbicella faveolata]